MISATVVQDSISPDKVRLTTLSLTYPRFILSEFNTHRTLSRNSASSRAIPTKKLLEEIKANPAMPVSWGKNQPGMQASENLDSYSEWSCRSLWLNACQEAVVSAQEMSDRGVHKQIVNRIVEPFMHARTVVTATDWDNFYALRRHKDAQPEIKALADAMWEAMQQSQPNLIEAGHWHTPYANHKTFALKSSTARCARVSYLTHEGKEPAIDKDVALHDKLQASGHWSPFEHPATPGTGSERYANYCGWKSYRYCLQNEDYAVLSYCSG